MRLLKELLDCVREIKQLLRNTNEHQSMLEEPITIEQAAEFLKKSRQDCYFLISNKAQDPLPHHRKGHKTIYFFKSELTSWVKRKQ